MRTFRQFFLATTMLVMALSAFYSCGPKKETGNNVKDSVNNSQNVEDSLDSDDGVDVQEVKDTVREVPKDNIEIIEKRKSEEKNYKQKTVKHEDLETKEMTEITAFYENNEMVMMKKVELHNSKNVTEYFMKGDMLKTAAEYEEIANKDGSVMVVDIHVYYDDDTNFKSCKFKGKMFKSKAEIDASQLVPDDSQCDEEFGEFYLDEVNTYLSLFKK